MSSSKLPLPVKAQGFRVMTSPLYPQGAVLDVDTDDNTIRIGFDKAQLERLARLASKAAAKASG